MAGEVFVAKKDGLKEGEKLIVPTGNTEIGVYRFEGKLYAYENLCGHQGGPACEGIVIAKVVEKIGEDRTYQGMTFDESEPHIVCPWHGFEYDLKTGIHVGDKRFRLKPYEVVERDDGIYVLT